MPSHLTDLTQAEPGDRRAHPLTEMLLLLGYLPALVVSLIWFLFLSCLRLAALVLVAALLLPLLIGWLIQDLCHGGSQTGDWIDNCFDKMIDIEDAIESFKTVPLRIVRSRLREHWQLLTSST